MLELIFQDYAITYLKQINTTSRILKQDYNCNQIKNKYLMLKLQNQQRIDIKR